jgi:hypothetical protein
MFKHLLSERGVLLNEPATVPRHELEVDEDRVGFVLQQTKAVDAGAVDCRKVGVIGFVSRVGGLAELFGGVGVNDADLDPCLGESALDRAVVATCPFDDGDQVFDAMLFHGVVDPP